MAHKKRVRVDFKDYAIYLVTYIDKDLGRRTKYFIVKSLSELVSSLEPDNLIWNVERYADEDGVIALS